MFGKYSIIVIICLMVITSGLVPSNFLVSAQTNDKTIVFATNFIDSHSVKLQISLINNKGNFPIYSANITDFYNNTIFKANPNGIYSVNTQNITIEKGKPYQISIVTTGGMIYSSVFFRTEHIIEIMPFDFWLGSAYQNNYNEFLSIFENAYNILVDIVRNGSSISTNGVTINREPWAVASGGYGQFNYAIMSFIETPVILSKAYLPNGSATITGNPNIPTTYTLSSTTVLDTMLHELTHAVVLSIPGSALLTQEGIACFFEADLFRLMGYHTEYVSKCFNGYMLFRQYVFDNSNYSNIAIQYRNSDPHVFPGGWIPAFILRDFVGAKEYDMALAKSYGSSYVSIDLIPDQGWNFLRNYYYFANTVQRPTQYNNEESLLYYFELASNMSLKQTFLNWGFNVSSYSPIPSQPLPTPTSPPIPETPYSQTTLLVSLVFVTIPFIALRKKLAKQVKN